MTSAFDVSDEAIRDLGQIWEHCAERDIRVADETHKRIKTIILEIVVKHPRSGRLRPEFGSQVHSFAIAPYVVFYRARRRRVEVLRVLHGHRDIYPPLMSLFAAG